VRAPAGTAWAAAAPPSRSVLMSAAARRIVILRYILSPFPDDNNDP